MKKKYMVESLVDKITAILLLICMTMVAAGCVMGIKAMYEYNIYADAGKTAEQYYLQTETSVNLEDAISYFTFSTSDLGLYDTRIESYRERFSEENSNFFFVITDSENNRLFSNYDGGDYRFKMTRSFTYYSDSGDSRTARIDGYVRSEFVAGDGYNSAFWWINHANHMRFVVFVLLLISIVIIVVLLTIISCSGLNNKDKDGKVLLTFIDRVPLDLCIIVSIGLVSMCWLIIGLTEVGNANMVLYNVVTVTSACITAIIIEMFTTTLCTRIAVGRPLRNTMVYRLITFIRRKAPRGIRRIGKSMSFFNKLVISVACINLLGMVVIAIFAYYELIKGEIIFDRYILVWLIERVVLIPIIVMLALNFQFIREKAQRLADGDLDDEDFTRRVSIKGFKAHSENLDHIRSDIVKAYEQEMRSEHLRNELISNVSHDIKTPLTSIINFIDLLRSDSLTAEQQKDYIDVLGRQADNLRCLLDSLIEASRASTGDVNLNLERTNVGVLLSQTLAEFDETLQAHNLELVVSTLADDVFITADGRLVLTDGLKKAGRFAAAGDKYTVAD